MAAVPTMFGETRCGYAICLELSCISWPIAGLVVVKV